MKTTSIICVLIAVLLTACNSESGTDSSATNAETDTTAKAAKIITDEAENGLAIGTDIKGLMKPAAPLVDEDEKDNLQTLTWDDLIPEGYNAESIIAKYQSKIMITPEGSPEEVELYKVMQAEFDQAPANTTLNTKMVKIPGFVSPLDESDGMVGEFLLVPYFGSCIHSPPPPVNQTVVVNPQQGKSIAMSKIRRPVWVIGEMRVERSTTDLAEAAYRIENARLEEYTQE